MFINFEQFNEALKLSDAKDVTQIWLKSGMKNYLNNWFKDNDRIYIPLNMNISLKELQHDTDIEKEVESTLNANGYEIESYVGNLCKKIGATKNFTKIAKILQKFAPKLVEQYNNELINMGVANDYMIVISRHPIDIAGMSTDRGWSSCMNLDGGRYNKYVQVDIKSGTIIAYLIKNDDKNIQSPISRLLMKPYIDKDGKSWLFPDKVYGSPNQFFEKTIEMWLEEMQGKAPTGVYNIKGGLYDDKADTIQKYDSIEKSIEAFVYKHGIKKYKINEDNSIDILEHFVTNDLTSFDIKINNVIGEFKIDLCENFKNFPNYVKGDFIVTTTSNSLYGCPKIVDGSFNIMFYSKNDITLLGIPTRIGGSCSLTISDEIGPVKGFKNVKYLQNCNIREGLVLKNIIGLTDLNFLPTKLYSLDIINSDLKSTNGINNCNISSSITISKCEYITKLENFPKEVKGTLDISQNNINTTEGFPEKVSGELRIYDNSITRNDVKTIATYGILD